MPCSICGDVCRCGSSPEANEEQSAVTQNDQRGNDLSEPAPDAWRAEVAARLNRYQSRRKPRPPRYPSLRLPFENSQPDRAANESSRQPPTLHLSHHALALDGFPERDDLDDVTVPSQIAPSTSEALPNADSTRSRDTRSATSDASTPPLTAKIIEFPRSWTPPMPPADQLAEPVNVHPRILEAPEITPPPPALGGITIEPAPKPEIERRPGIDFPLQSASLARRISAAAIDATIILAACSVFGFIFWKITALRPPTIQAAEIIAGLTALLWAAYQYLLIVYAGTTPGLRLMRLALSRFDGTPANSRSRRWRVLASFLSALSLGMGYAWVFLDEDALCWHDRITHTYLSPSVPMNRPRS
jgi:uncharacterized RDD family membrane protein YckC